MKLLLIKKHNKQNDKHFPPVAESPNILEITRWGEKQLLTGKILTTQASGRITLLIKTTHQG